MNAVAELTKKKQNLESQSTGLTTGVEAQRAALATTTKDLENANTTLNLINKATYDTRRELAEMAPKAETAKMLIENSGLIIGGVAGTIFILLLVGSYLLKKKTFSDNSLKTLKTVLILRKKIDDLRKTIIVIFPELTVQFAFIDSEVKKCEQDSTRKNDIVQAYQCSMKYFMGSYALVMYSTLLQFVKDGGNLNSLNRLSDVHGYKGFATLNTRQLIFKLNEFYSLMIEYDATMNDAFESIFYLMKKQILENRSSDNIIKQLPNNLALGRV